MNVKVHDVFAECNEPASGLAKPIEARLTAKLKAKGRLAKKGETDFSTLIASVLCGVPIGSKNSETTCHVGLLLREHVEPADWQAVKKSPAGWRFPSGIVGTYYAHYSEPFALKKDLIDAAMDKLMERFFARVEWQERDEARQKAAAAKAPKGTIPPIDPEPMPPEK